MKKPSILAIAFASTLFIFATTKHSIREISHPFIAESPLALFSELHLEEQGMKPTVFTIALRGLRKLAAAGAIRNSDTVTIIDFSQPSTKRRLYVLDLLNKQVLFNTLVAHGRNSGTLWAHSFSNALSSLKSSPGFYLTGETYMGENGYSLRLDGLERNVNSNARARSIVLHGADYVDESMINSTGYLGRSWGCPAVPLSDHEAIINTIKEGTCLFIYAPGKTYLKRSPILYAPFKTKFS